MIHRRSVLAGLISVLAAPAIVRAQNIMLVRVLQPPDPLVRGIFWQSWPFRTSRPEYWTNGMVFTDFMPMKPMSYFAAEMERHRSVWPNLDWRPLHELPSQRT